MGNYYVNKNAQNNGDHEVHIDSCSYLPDVENRISLGYFYNCEAAVTKAKEHYDDVDGCYYCCNGCHTS